MKIELLTLIIILQVADAWTTFRLVAPGGRERNRVMRFLIDKLGIVPAILMTKTAYFALLIGTFPDLPEWFLAAVAAAYVLVVSNNAHQMAVAKQ